MRRLAAAQAALNLHRDMVSKMSANELGAYDTFLRAQAGHLGYAGPFAYTPYELTVVDGYWKRIGRDLADSRGLSEHERPFGVTDWPDMFSPGTGDETALLWTGAKLDEIEQIGGLDLGDHRGLPRGPSEVRRMRRLQEILSASYVLSPRALGLYLGLTLAAGLLLGALLGRHLERRKRPPALAPAPAPSQPPPWY